MDAQKEELKRQKREARKAAARARREEEERKAKFNKDGTPKTTKQIVISEIISWVIVIAIAGTLALILNLVFVMKAEVISGSMLDTLQIGDIYVGNRLAEPDRGDIFFFEYPDDRTQVFVKRIIGLPGETLEIKEGKVYINDAEEPLEEPYLREKPRKLDYGPIQIPEGCYFMMGDNRNHSNDSRYWQNTFVTEDELLAEAWFRMWPPLKFVEHYDYEGD